jgi:hypothetical protein
MEVPLRVFGALLLFACLTSSLRGQPTQTAAANSDGGVDRVLQSIYIPPLTNAPFTALVHTQWIRPLPDGGTYTLVNQRQVARDTAGRIYEERWLLVPKDGMMQSQMNVIQIADPASHTLYNCFTLNMPHRCSLVDYSETATSAYIPLTMVSGQLPNGNGFSVHENLGGQSFEGIDTRGTRDTVTYNEGVIGNDRPFSRVREFWFAPSLGINLKSEVSDPGFGKQIFTVTDIRTTEPDPKLFELPDGFVVVDHKKPAAPSQ